ncbi:MAG: aminopeptidase, partial [Bacteroidales bacterium]|nr:aminopeptidase [Bacteroidales bacterium]
DKPFNQMYTVKFLGNVVEGRPVTYLNREMDRIKAAAVRQLQDGHPVWFGSDCSKFSFRKDGIFDRDTAAVEKLFNVKFNFTKEEYLDYGDSAMNHAMVILGVNLDENGKPNRWHIENSWGDEAGQDGYFVASDSWFDSFVYQVVVNKKYLDEESAGFLGGELHELEPWDPFGTLAD